MLPPPSKDGGGGQIKCLLYSNNKKKLILPTGYSVKQQILYEIKKEIYSG